MSDWRHTALLFLASLLLALAPLGCDRTEEAACPIRAVWAHALRGEYDILKDVYLGNRTEGQSLVFDTDRNGFVWTEESADSVIAHAVKGTCIDALAAMADDGAMLTLAQILKAQTIPDLRIAQRIVASGNGPAMETIYELAESEYLEIRSNVALAFSCCDFAKCGSRAVNLLCRMLKDEERGVSIMAAHALGKVPASLPEQHSKAKQNLIEYFHRPESLRDDTIMQNLGGAFESLEGPEVQEFIRWLLARAKNPPRDDVFCLLDKLPEAEAIGYIEKYSQTLQHLFLHLEH